MFVEEMEGCGLHSVDEIKTPRNRICSAYDVTCKHQSDRVVVGVPTRKTPSCKQPKQERKIKPYYIHVVILVIRFWISNFRTLYTLGISHTNIKSSLSCCSCCRSQET
jgi:hypothetical protein